MFENVGTYVSTVRVELLEREAALETLAQAHAAAAGGSGRAVGISGEPGIGKTALVRRFLDDLEDGARVLFGSCDDLSIARPLGPFRDLAGSVSPGLREALAAGAPPHEIQDLLIQELERTPRPTLLVLEDVHWADNATLDSLTVLGRRIGTLPALLVTTHRTGETPPGHPLHAALGAVRPDDSELIELFPLSRNAVASLAGEDADAVYDVTRGNPFYVTELLAARDTAELPPSVANAVLARTSRLDDSARRLVELVSVVPNRVSTSTLDSVMPGWAAAAEEPERRQLLELDAAHLRFRHELARNAVLTAIPTATCRRLHSDVLGSLLAASADPAEIVHHAEAAGEDEVVGEYALIAARRAAAFESNREAYSHYRRAADFLDMLSPLEQADLQSLAIFHLQQADLPVAQRDDDRPDDHHQCEQKQDQSQLGREGSSGGKRQSKHASDEAAFVRTRKDSEQRDEKGERDAFQDAGQEHQQDGKDRPSSAERHKILREREDLPL